MPALAHALLQEAEVVFTGRSCAASYRPHWISVSAVSTHKDSCRPGEAVWSAHNVLMRAIVTTIYMAIITLICCLIPFFGCATPSECLIFQFCTPVSHSSEGVMLSSAPNSSPALMGMRVEQSMLSTCVRHNPKPAWASCRINQHQRGLDDLSLQSHPP